MGKPEAILQKGSVCGVPLLIFVCVGSRPYPFDRLIKELDSLVENGKIASSIFAQIGASSYKPKNFEFAQFMDSDDYKSKMREADIVISHGASGSIMEALNAGKRVIAVTRLAKYGEHINDHQVAINETLADEGLVLSVFDLADLGEAIERMESGKVELKPWHNDNPTAIVDAIDEFIRKEVL